MAKRKKTTKSSRFPIFLIAIGLVLMGIWGMHRYFYNRSLSLSDALLATYSQKRGQVALPIHITAGEKIKIPVVEGGKINGVWTVSATAANHVLNSAIPGESGNIIIYGHNTLKIFGNIQSLTQGDIIQVRTTDGVLHKYKVTITRTVSPSKTDLLAPTKTEVLTLYTCTGLLDSLRFVVRAIPTQ